MKIFKARDLLWEWTARNIRARYQQSLLGWLWAIVQPTAQVAIFTIVFTVIVPVDTGVLPYVIFSYVGIVPWTFLSMALPDMANSLVDNMSLVNKIYFPREILPIAALLARLMDFFVASILIVILLIVYQVPVSPLAIVYVPLILGVQVLLTLGIGIATAAANVFLRDVRSLMVLGLQLWFYATPIIYPATLVKDELLPFYFLNPMSGIVESYRDVVLRSQMPGEYLISAAVMSLLIFIGGFWFFRRVEFQFADIV